MPNLYNFIKKEEKFIKEVDALVAIYEHEPTGAKLLHIPNDDKNKVFNIEFVTIPEDNTGIAHILEHSVLCGSEKFPLKEPFVNLLKGSMNTFLNAMTFPDKTMYPFASLNEQDFMNILDVYLDAVFAPNIKNDPLILKQEGWRYELFSKDEDPKFNGVVFNEMKGAMSSPEEKIDQLCSQYLYDNTYQYNSGGDPLSIPDLMEEQFLSFYNRFYHPSNAYIYLYGDMPLETVLKELDDKFSIYEKQLSSIGEVISATHLNKPQYIIDTYPGKSTDLNYAQLQFVYPHSKKDELIAHEYAMSIIATALFNMESSALRQNLLDKEIAEEIYAYANASLMNPNFSVTFVGVKNFKPQEIEKLVFEELEKAVNNYDQSLFEATFNAFSFNLREGDSQTTPQGLIRGIGSMINWPYGRNPLETLAFEKHLAKVEELIQSGDILSFVQNYLLENSHRICAYLSPEESKIEVLQQKETDLLQNKFNSFDACDIDDIIRMNQELREKQNTPDTKEALSTLPTLTREDLEEKHNYLALKTDEISLPNTNIPFLTFFGNSRGILYLSYQFDCTEIKQEQLFELSLLQEILGYVDTEKFSFSELTNYSLANTGGIATNLVYTKKRAYFEVKIKFLQNKISESINLINEILLHSKFIPSKNRIFKLLTTLYSRMKSSLADSGITLARKRLRSYIDPVGTFDEVTSGITSYHQLGNLLENWEQDSDIFLDTLQNIMSLLIKQNHLTLFFAGEKSDWSEIEEKISTQLSNLPKNANSSANNYPDWKFDTEVKNEAFKVASDVQYVVAGVNIKSIWPDWEFDEKLHLLRQIINTDYLWNHVRVKGGAYGCSITVERNGNLLLASYRDPQCKKTYEAYANIVNYLEQINLDEEQLTSYLIGTFSSLDQPLSFPATANRAKAWYDRDIEIATLQEERSALLNITNADLQQFAEQLAKLPLTDIRCTIGNQKIIDQDKDLFEQILVLE